MKDIEFIESCKKRTKDIAIRIINLVQKINKNDESRIISKHLLRCATSVGANYRAACRARSQAEYYSKISIVIEELDETLFWMELLIESGIVKENMLVDLMKECNELLKIFAKSRKTLNEKFTKN
ncbi:MAG: four helix bundle protein [Bacteroidota bacterium]|nr:four helix bundle protein [Bacteroidota bacterium]